MSGELFLLTPQKHGVWSLVLNRPQERNTLTDALVADLQTALDNLSQKSAEECRILTISGEGTIFCAGADLKQMKEKKDLTFEQNLAHAEALGKLFYTLAVFPAPVVCAAQGAAIGGGLGMVACCDLTIAAEGTIFATSEVSLGIVPGVISPYVVRKVGAAHGSDMMLTARRVDAAEAKEMGLINRVAKPHELLMTLQELVENLKKAGPNALRRTKQLIQKVSPLPDAELQHWTALQIAESRAGAEGQAGLEAFLSKTKAPWQQDSHKNL
jgi:methylglutaconyl-CoA hydratase